MKINFKSKIFCLIVAIMLISWFYIFQTKLNSTKTILEYISKKSSQFQAVINLVVIPNIDTLKEVGYIAFFLLVILFCRFVQNEYFKVNKNN